MTPGRAGGVRAAASTLVVLVAAAVLCPPTAGAATSVSQERLRSLAEAAADDPQALTDLRAVERVDGMPVDVRAALAGAAPPELDERLELLARSRPVGAEPSAAAARADAESILTERRFRAPPLPRPFEGPIEAIADFLAPIVSLIGDFFGGLDDGPSALLLVAVALAVLVAAAVLAARSIRRRIRTARVGAFAGRADPAPDDADELERRAEEAERRGEASEALRLRFRAGLVRLDVAGAIRLRPSLPNGELTRSLRSPTFASLAADFDAVAYGGRAASDDDVVRARSEWPRVLIEAGGR
jgi:hypothetical protein